MRPPRTVSPQAPMAPGVPTAPSDSAANPPANTRRPRVGLWVGLAVIAAVVVGGTIVGALAGDDQLQSLQIGGVQLHLGGGPVMHEATGALEAPHGAQKLALGGGVVVPVGVARRPLLWGPGHGRRVSE